MNNANCSSSLTNHSAEYLRISQKLMTIDNTVVKVQLTVVCIAIVLNALFTTVSISGIIKKELPFRLYLFLTSRSIADFCTSIVIVVRIATYFGSGFQLVTTLVILTLMTFFYMASAASYAALACLKLLAVSKPLYYYNFVTNPRCIRLVGFAWIFAVLCAAIMGYLSSSIVRSPSLSLFCSDFDSCVHFTQLSCSIIIGITWSIVSIQLILTLYFAVRQRHIPIRTQTVSSRRNSGLGGLRRLIVHLFLLQICTLLEGPSVYLSMELIKACTSDENSIRHLFFITIVPAIGEITFSLRLVLDPIITVFSDLRYRQILSALLLNRKCSEK